MARYRLGDICTIISGSTPKTEVAEYWDGGFKWITPAELNDDSYIIEDSARKLTALGVQKTGLTPFPAGTIILSSRAPIGKVAIAGCEMYCNQGFKNLICSEIVHNKYLFWYLKGKTEYLNSLGRGATFKEISKQIVGGIEIELPPMEEQIAIARRFEQLNLLLHKRKQEITMLDQLIKARFVEMFGEETEHGVPLKECCIDVRGGGTPSMQHPEYYGGNVPFIKSGDVRGDMVSSGALWLTEKALEETIAKYVPQGSVLVVNRSAALLREFRAAIAARPVVINQDIKAFIPKHDYTSEYLLWAIKIQTKMLLTKVTTVLTSHIDLKELLELRIANVSIERQKEFSAFISQVDKSKLSIQASLDQLVTLKQSLMQKYFG